MKVLRKLMLTSTSIGTQMIIAKALQKELQKRFPELINFEVNLENQEGLKEFFKLLLVLTVTTITASALAHLITAALDEAIFPNQEGPY